MKLREKFPELMLEAGMVVLAVLAALAVEEWRDVRQQHELADRALAVVLAEIQANAAELGRNRAGNQTLLDDVVAADRAGELPDDFNLTFEYSLISTSGWETARVTQATHFMPIERVQELSQLYGLQGLYQSAQDKVLAFIFDIGAVARDDPDKIPSMVRGPLSQAVMMDQLLGQAYDSLLIRIERDGGDGAN
jgi:hypothetical protein